MKSVVPALQRLVRSSSNLVARFHALWTLEGLGALDAALAEAGFGGIARGEETGALDDMLTRIADFYDSEVDTAVDALTSLIEPVMIVVMAGGVGFLLLSVLSAMFSLIANVGSSMSR